MDFITGYQNYYFSEHKKKTPHSGLYIMVCHDEGDNSRLMCLFSATVMDTSSLLSPLKKIAIIMIKIPFLSKKIFYLLQSTITIDLSGISNADAFTFSFSVISNLMDSRGTNLLI